MFIEKEMNQDKRLCERNTSGSLARHRKKIGIHNFFFNCDPVEYNKREGSDLLCGQGDYF